MRNQALIEKSKIEKCIKIRKREFSVMWRREKEIERSSSVSKYSINYEKLHPVLPSSPPSQHTAKHSQFISLLFQHFFLHFYEGKQGKFSSLCQCHSREEFLLLLLCKFNSKIKVWKSKNTKIKINCITRKFPVKITLVQNILWISLVMSSFIWGFMQH